MSLGAARAAHSLARTLRVCARRGISSAACSEVCIVAAVRTPIGGFNGSLSALTAPQLGAAAIEGALKQANVEKAVVDECWMGNVLSAGMGQAPARQAAKAAGLPDSTVCTTINKVCSSGMKAIVLASQQISLGLADVAIAGGMESMSNVPYLLPKARFGARMGDAKMVDAMVGDGLWDPYGNCHMGSYAELCADTHTITREDQDAHADESYRRARAAHEASLFVDEIVPVEVPGKRGATTLVTVDDECANPPRPSSQGRAAFKKDGTVTAANASTISDGAAAVLLMSRAAAEKHGCEVLATIKGYGDAEQEPCWFTTAPSAALPKAAAHAGVALSEVDYFEINEAFSVVSVANNRLLALDPEKVNVNGGAVSLGHPIGASGARIVVTLVNVMKQRGASTGAAGICNGGGGASAIVIGRG